MLPTAYWRSNMTFPYGKWFSRVDSSHTQNTFYRCCFTVGVGLWAQTQQKTFSRPFFCSWLLQGWDHRKYWRKKKWFTIHCHYGSTRTGSTIRQIKLGVIHSKSSLGSWPNSGFYNNLPISQGFISWKFIFFFIKYVYFQNLKPKIKQKILKHDDKISSMGKMIFTAEMR